jgi:hypothetical protein
VGWTGAILAVGSLVFAWGCEADGNSSPDAPAPTPVEVLDVSGVETRLFSIEGLEGPEAVKYDAAQDVYFISNFGPSDDPDTNDGYLSRVSAEDGAVEELRWAVGDADRPLREPRGMALAGDTLWVADSQGLHAFDPVTGTQLDFVDLSGLEPGFLNDVAAGPDGGIYVTDTGESRLIRLVGRTGIVVAEGASLGNPNGIVLEPASGRLVLVPWEAGGDSIRIWDPVHRTLEIWARSPGGPFDGAEFSGPDLVVASQGDSALHLVRGGAGQVFQKVAGRPADIAIDSRRGRIAVPYIALDRVDVFPGPPGG